MVTVLPAAAGDPVAGCPPDPFTELDEEGVNDALGTEFAVRIGTVTGTICLMRVTPAGHRHVFDNHVWIC